ncbi:snRNA-activating protein complex subunit 3-like protein [Perkinsela sp. CCAP 1560/4]|nr:snRNA-activating protein complex subunit 3-like protein [Perkinsela sp. CCAP 1560/4]|eukprot:KNH04073.1 snRNA-activating protein complex subunit 3-like protein [Perkinsela sp. CCAP 1560/4]
MAGEAGPLYSTALFQQEVDALREPKRGKQAQTDLSTPPLLPKSLYQNLLKFVQPEDGEITYESAASRYKNRRAKNFIKEIDTEVDEHVERLCRLGQSFDSESVRQMSSSIPSYAQRLHTFSSNSPLISLQEPSRCYLKRCCPNQYRGQGKRKDLQLAHRPPSDSKLSGYQLEVAVCNAVKGNLDSIFLMSPQSTLFQLRSYINCKNISTSIPFIRNIGTENGPMDPIEFFYINGIFYTDPFPPSKEAIEYIYIALTLVEHNLDAETVMKYIRPMSETRICDLHIQCDSVSGCYSHFGTVCTHILTFRDYFLGVGQAMDRMANKSLQATPIDAPTHLYMRRRVPFLCDSCHVVPPSALRYFDSNTPYHPTLLCYFCHTRMLDDYAPSDNGAIVIERPPGEYSGF